MQYVYDWLPALSFLYASILFPLLSLISPSDMLDSRVEHRIFWPLVAIASLLISGVLALQRPLPRLSTSNRLLVGYLALACLSICWSPVPNMTGKRALQELFVVAATMVPVLVSQNKGAIFDRLLGCMALGIALNLVFVGVRPPTELGHAGMYTQKNVLGQYAAVSFLFSMFYWKPARCWQFPCALFIATIAIVLLMLSQSKTSLGLSIGMPAVAAIGLLVSQCLRISPRVAILLLVFLASLIGFLAADAALIGFEDVSLAMFGDVTFTGRTYIWSFAADMADRRPWLGWGYQSFWLVGRDASSVVEAPGFVAIMPHAHNGYLDVRLETGWLGLLLLGLLIFSALNGAGGPSSGRRSHHDWVTLSVVLFLIAYNMMESSWTRGFDLAWLLFLIVAGYNNARPEVETRLGRALASVPLRDRHITC